MQNSSLKIGFIGAGRTASALATGLAQSGYRIAAIASRTHESARLIAETIQDCHAEKDSSAIVTSCDFVFITTPDDSIETVAGQIHWREGMAVVHCSGAKTSDILKNAKDQGALTASFHPMQTFPKTGDGTHKLSGISFAIEGDPLILDELKKMAASLGGWPVEVSPEDRVIYHLSGFLACGAVTSLMSQASSLWEILGYKREYGLKVLLPLLKSTVASIETHGIADSLTGPISRGDIGTVERHIDALHQSAKSILPVYKSLASEALTIASQYSGIDQSSEKALRTLLKDQIYCDTKEQPI